MPADYSATVPETTAEITFDLQPNDYVALSDFTRGKRDTDTQWMARFVLFVGSIAATTVSLIAVGSASVSSLLIATILTAVFVLVYTAALSPWKSQRSRLNSYYQSRRLICTRTIHLGDQGLRQTTEDSETFYRWDAFDRLAVADSHLFLFTSSISAFIFPRRVFRTEQDFIAFVGVAQQYWNPASAPGGVGGFPVLSKNSPRQSAE
jgi:YcxB-like protein